MVIETSRLIIRYFVPNDWTDLYEYLSDKDVVKFEPYNVLTEEQVKTETTRRANDKSFYAVCLKDNSKLIGNLYLGEGDFNTCELGFVFNINFHGLGYASESAKALLDYAFHELCVRRIIAMCNPKNQSSWRLLERIGMRREGLLLQNIFFKTDADCNPIWNDTYEYAILKSEWDIEHGELKYEPNKIVAKRL